jgi:hypothetical protein
MVRCEGGGRAVVIYVLGPVPGVDVMAKGPQGWVQCEDRPPYMYTTKITPAACHDSTTPRLARTSAGAPGVQGPLEWGFWGFNAARGRCSGQLHSK